MGKFAFAQAFSSQIARQPDHVPGNDANAVGNETHLHVKTISAKYLKL